jgi:uncharacterized membrane protein
MVGMAIFTAMIIIFQLIATFVKIGSFPITLVLIPIVVGAAVYGPKSGAWFGGVFGFVVLIACIFGWDPGGNILWNASPFLTALLCLVKGIAAGYISGLVYAALSKNNIYLGVVAAAIVCPIVNTGIFCVAMVLLFHKILVEWAAGQNIVFYLIFGIAGINFLIEMAVNVVLCPAVTRIIKAGKLA